MPSRTSSPGGLLSSSAGDRRSHTAAWRLSVGVALAGLAVTVGLALWTSNRTHDEAVRGLAAQGQRLADSVDSALDEVVERLVAVGSLFQATDEVTQDGFRTFVSNFAPISGMEGIGYMPIVESDDLAEFEAEVSRSIAGYTVFQFDDRGDRVPVEPRSFHVPVQWFEPAEAFGRPHGFDSTSEPMRRSALIRARTDKDPAVTAFLRLVSEDEEDGFLIYWPVSDPDTGEVFAFTVAPMDLSALLEGQIDASVSEELVWSIEEVSGGRRPAETVDNSWSTVMDVGSNWWALTVSRAGEERFQLTRSGITLVLVLVGGLITTLFGAIGAYLYRRKSETQLELDKLRSLSREKDQFLASVSHELRTPLTGVLGFAELLREAKGDLTEEERRSMIVNVAEEATDLAAIIDDLLVAARSELDLLEITRVPVSYRAQVAQIVETVAEETRARIQVVAGPGGDAVAMGDPGRVRQIVRNLITNAVRYGGDRIEVRFGGEGDMVHLDVVDNGPGLPPQERDRIFEPYYRAHHSDTQPAALGIGLSVARHLARLMTGDLSYLRADGWSVFRLALPSAQPGSSKHRAAVSAGMVDGTG